MKSTEGVIFTANINGQEKPLKGTNIKIYQNLGNNRINFTK